MSISVKKITSSRAFWITAGLVILFWLLRRCLFWGALTATYWWSNMIAYLVFQGPYVLPLIIPMILFYLFAKKRKIFYLITTVVFFIVWVPWSAYVSAWFMHQWGGGFIITEKDKMNLLTILIFSVISMAYIFQCKDLLCKEGTRSSSKEKILWLSWFISVTIIIASAWACSHIGSYLASTLRDARPWDPHNYISNLVDYLFMWLLFSLPATLKIDDALSKESKI